MNVFSFRERLIKDYSEYIRSFLLIREERLSAFVREQLAEGVLWPEPLVQLNPAFAKGLSTPELIKRNILSPECQDLISFGVPPKNIHLYQHQVEGVQAASQGSSYVLTTGTGSGKSLAYMVPIIDHVLREGSGGGVKAVVIYPMNALANSQLGELEKLIGGPHQGEHLVKFARYTGQESDEERQNILADPPDILLTNYMMLELILTRPFEQKLVTAFRSLRFLVLDELHTYRGRQGADVAMLARRLRAASGSRDLICVGTSATLAGGKTWADQRTEVAALATQMFGQEVAPENVIGETLKRRTDPWQEDELDSLRVCLERRNLPSNSDFQEFLVHPLVRWVESRLGLREEADSGRLIRQKPRSLGGPDGLATELAVETGCSLDAASEMLRQVLLQGARVRSPDDGRVLFAFRLHQFISKGAAVYASLAPPDERYLTLNPQRFVPGSDRSKVMLPLAFCRECGQEYYTVRRHRDVRGDVVFLPREASDRLKEEDTQAGFLYKSSGDPWPKTNSEVIERLPEGWLEQGKNGLIIKRGRRERVPKHIFLDDQGREFDEAKDGAESELHEYVYFPAPFSFCLCCGVAYGFRQRSDFGKLATLGSEGRSTATTVLGLSSLEQLHEDDVLAKHAKKLLSFTDNRQDASLQAGHFNDFVQVVQLRSALYQALAGAANKAIEHDELPKAVFDALALPLHAFAANPNVKYNAKADAENAMRKVIAYLLYQDQRRGWRVTSPNMEQCGLLKIKYKSLEEICSDEDLWSASQHADLIAASPEERQRVTSILLDFMRRELAIYVEELDSTEQERLVRSSRQHLKEPWLIEDERSLITSKVLKARARDQKIEISSVRHVVVSVLSGFGQYLRRPSTFKHRNQSRLGTEAVDCLISTLLATLEEVGLLRCVEEPSNKGDSPGYQLTATSMLWCIGDGRAGAHDPIRMPQAPNEGLSTNPFFVDLYSREKLGWAQMEAREHTAQVPSPERLSREELFRSGELPLLFCSPTMELGVDIADLNVVNMRNVPPTPANYAQRSGRAGRSGSPAIVYTYCSAGSPHDQHFFQHPEQMVSGSVTTPMIDLMNEGLILAHVHAIWLGHAGVSLGSSLLDVLEVSTGQEGNDFPINEDISIALRDEAVLARTRADVEDAMGDLLVELLGAERVHTWLEHALNTISLELDAACDRWRGLHASAREQIDHNHEVILDASRTKRDRATAQRLRAEAEAQLRLLQGDDGAYNDFYSYRYLASEGFLPGYNFPRLPLSAYLPGRRKGHPDDFLSRPRFLAISEFGPSSVIYHEGSRYVVNRVILPVRGADENRDNSVITCQAKRCGHCGYLHSIDKDELVDLCECCGETLEGRYTNLFKMQNVTTRRRDYINSDEEERQRHGYELETAVRFAKRGGETDTEVVLLQGSDTDAGSKAPDLTLTYAHAATIWRMNLGWSRAKENSPKGFMLDIERGYWVSKSKTDDLEKEGRVQRVVPFVEDHKNCLLVAPESPLELEVMASLEAALKVAIQRVAQLEDRELASEALPEEAARNRILFFEAAEGGAGVLRSIVRDPKKFSMVVRGALEVCHFDPDTGEDLGMAEGAKERCEAACYDCLLSYYNQRDHQLLDRFLIKDVLLSWAGNCSPEQANSEVLKDPRKKRLEDLRGRCDSELEQDFLDLLETHQLRLPDHAQKALPDVGVRPDFIYASNFVLVFIDGPSHDSKTNQKRDRTLDLQLEALGWTVLRLRYDEDWLVRFEELSWLFGVLGPRK